jgi:hypothetical protein
MLSCVSDVDKADSALVTLVSLSGVPLVLCMNGGGRGS